MGGFTFVLGRPTPATFARKGFFLRTASARRTANGCVPPLLCRLSGVRSPRVTGGARGAIAGHAFFFVARGLAGTGFFRGSWWSLSWCSRACPTRFRESW